MTEQSTASAEPDASYHRSIFLSPWSREWPLYSHNPERMAKRLWRAPEENDLRQQHDGTGKSGAQKTREAAATRLWADIQDRTVVICDDRVMAAGDGLENPRIVKIGDECTKQGAAG